MSRPIIPAWMSDVDLSRIGFPLRVDKELYTKRTKIPYKRVSGEILHLDAYRPVTPAPHPLVLLIHGGSWTRGGRFQMGLTKWAGYLASAGLGVISIDYRLAPATTYPDSFQDCLDALDWAIGHAEELAVDPTRVGLWGDSAGGHLVLLLATSQTNPTFRGPRLRSSVERLRAVVAFYPPTDLLHLHRAEQRGSTPGNTVRSFVGADPEVDPERWREASPIEHVHSGLPPIMILQGTRDLLVPHSQAIRFGERLAASGAPHEIEIVEDGLHGFERLAPGPREQALIVRSRDFLCRHLDLPVPTRVESKSY